MTAWILALALQAGAMPGLNVPDLCAFVAFNVAETNAARGTRWVYQTRLFEAAGVVAGQDDAAVTRQKMQTFWNRNQTRFLCSVAGTNVRNAHVLRLAVDASNTEFLNDVVRRWQVDLNFRDPGDGGTVLDFIDSELRQWPDSSRAVIFRRYRAMFVQAGAKNARDLG